jgi:pimeloyl-ACP methyl ester carboxylesterase
MSKPRTVRDWLLTGAARVIVGLVIVINIANCRGDTIIMKNGLIYRSMGTPDKDNTLVFIWDGLKRVIVRDSKIEKMVADNSYRTGERFQLVQPLHVHAGVMPKEVLSVQAGPWDNRGRRSFQYVGSRSKRAIAMEQAINEIGPHVVKYRGIDGFWKDGCTETNQVPRDVIMALFGRVEQKNASERERVVRFLMDVGWYPEAKRELDRLVVDFPKTDLSERAATARIYFVQSEAAQRRLEVDARRKAQQPIAVAELLKSFKEKEIGTDLLVEIREIARKDEQQAAADKAIIADLKRQADQLPAAARTQWKKPMVEVLKALETAPDAVRTRFDAWLKSKADSTASLEARFALAMSGYVVGSGMAISDLKAAESLWQGRDLVRQYLAGGTDANRGEQLSRLEGVAWPTSSGTPDPIHRLELVTAICRLMPPPLSGGTDRSDKPITHKVIEDENTEPTEYVIKLPPEYHPLRKYPAVVVLHSGQGPNGCVDQWSAEAAKHGAIVLAPEYMLPGQPPEYHYTQSEHAAVELALRDARKRYSIDSDRVFVAGQLTGGSMAWDYGLAHPDLFAGAIVFSGYPAKYVPRYLSHHEKLPLLFVTGDLAPASGEFVFDKVIKPRILKAWDITYMEYYHRGLEEFPEEIPRAFEWMDRHRRDPYPRSL